MPIKGDPFIGAAFGQAAWLPLLRSWADLMDRYSDAEGPDGDVPYWYGERALTGLLTAAAWRVPNGWSLEEFLGRRDEDAAGRGDAWLGIGTAEFTIEAKAVWPQADSEAALAQIQQQMDIAADQLRSLEKAFRVGQPLAVCYVIPDLSQERWLDAPEQLETLFQFLNQAHRGSSSVIAEYKPNRATPPRDGTRCYPGLVFVGRLIDSW